MASRILQVIIAGDAKGAIKAFQDADKAAGSHESKLSGVQKAAAGLAVAGAASLVAFGAKSVSTYEQVGTEVLKLQRYTGDSAESASKMRFAFQESGVDVDTAARSMGIFSKNIEKNPQKLTDLGIAAKDSNGHIRPMNDLLLDLSAKFASMPNGVEKNALALQLFGRGGMEMVRVLNQGRDGLVKLEAEAEKYGLELKGNNAAAVQKAIQAHREMHAAVQGLELQIGQHLLPVVTATTKFFATEIPRATHLVDEAFRLPVLKQAIGLIGDLPKPVQEGVLAFGGLAFAGGALSKHLGLLKDGFGGVTSASKFLWAEGAKGVEWFRGLGSGAESAAMSMSTVATASDGVVASTEAQSAAQAQLSAAQAEATAATDARIAAEAEFEATLTSEGATEAEVAAATATLTEARAAETTATEAATIANTELAASEEAAGAAGGSAGNKTKASWLGVLGPIGLVTAAGIALGDHFTKGFQLTKAGGQEIENVLNHLGATGHMLAGQAGKDFQTMMGLARQGIGKDTFFDQINKSLTSLIQSGHVDAYKRELAALRQEWIAGGGHAADFDKHVAESKAALDGATQSAQDATAATGRGSAATRSATADWQAAATAISANATALDSWKQQVQSWYDWTHKSADAEVAFQQAVDDTNLKLVQGGLSFDINTQAGRDNVRGLESLGKSIIDVGDAELSKTHSVKAATDAVNAHVQELRNEWAQAGMTTEQIDRMVFAMGLTPELILTKFNIDAQQAETGAANLDDHYNKTATPRHTAFTADSAQGHAAADAWKGEVASVSGTKNTDFTANATQAHAVANNWFSKIFGTPKPAETRFDASTPGKPIAETWKGEIGSVPLQRNTELTASANKAHPVADAWKGAVDKIPSERATIFHAAVPGQAIAETWKGEIGSVPLQRGLEFTATASLAHTVAQGWFNKIFGIPVRKHTELEAGSTQAHKVADGWIAKIFSVPTHKDTEFRPHATEAHKSADQWAQKIASVPAWRDTTFNGHTAAAHTNANGWISKIFSVPTQRDSYFNAHTEVAEAHIQHLLDLMNLAGRSVLTNFNPFGGGGGRAEGGSVTKDVPYVVGEKGWEVFWPDSHGTIIPNHQLNVAAPRPLSDLFDPNRPASLSGPVSAPPGPRLAEVRTHLTALPPAGSPAGAAPAPMVHIGELHLHVQGSVLSEDNLTETVRKGLIKLGQRTGQSVLGGHA